MQVDADTDTNQMLTLRGDECLELDEVQSSLYTKLYNYFLSNPEQVWSVLLYLPTSPCIGQAYQGLESHHRMVFDKLGLESMSVSQLRMSP